MKIKNALLSSFIVALVLIFLTGCGSSLKKADIPSTANPTTETANLETDIKSGYENHYDVLAEKDFNQSTRYLEKAKEGLRKGSKQSDILDDVAYGRAHLEQAKLIAAKANPKIQGLLDSRKAAIDAGAKNFSQLKDKLKDLDDDLRDNSKNLDKELSSNEYSKLQQGYQNLELLAVQTTQLGKARAMITGAKDNDAQKNTPVSLKTAEISLKNAENTIATHRQDPASYRSAVATANRDAQFLVDVLAVTKRKDSNIDEASAVKLVSQTNEIKKLNADVGAAESTIDAMDQNLSQKEKSLRQANAAVSIQKTIENARSQFNKEEAQAFQQGDKLLIRLNTMAFPSGRAELPSGSLELLAKVKNVAEQLKPSEILVEGHTDSTGSEALNQKLSQKRAASVAQYFETNGLDSAKISSVGYGFKKPIASNKSAAGREQNRRVDIVITPGNDSTGKNATTLNSSVE